MWVETARLILRNFEPQDCKELAPILANPQVMKFSSNGVLSIHQTQKKIERFMTCYKQFGFGKWAVVFKESNQLIGYCGIAIEQIENQEETEIGYRLDPRFWNCGLATEAATTVVRYGFNQLHLPYIIGVVEPENIASIRVLQKLGMQYCRDVMFNGVPMNVYRVENSQHL